MSEPATHIESLGKEGDPCRTCGVPLAADQRYCLNCGQRRGAPRVEFHDYLTGAENQGAANGRSAPEAPAPTQAASASTPPPEQRQPQRDYAPLAAVGGIAVLGLMLLVGVLIGKGNSSTNTPAPAPIVRFPEAAGQGTASEGAGAGKPGSKQAKSKGSAKKGSLLSGAKGGGKAATASDEELQKLQEQSPEEYQESSRKLPDEIATPGAPPPTDNKAPGGGSKGTAIE